MASGLVSIVGLNKLLKKLDPDTLIKPAEAQLFSDAASQGRAYLAGRLAERFPQTSAGVHSESTAALGKISANRYPYVFFERGSQYPVATHVEGGFITRRSHKRRRGVAVSALRIKPRRFLAATRALIRQNLKAQILEMKARIEKAWAA